MDHSHTGYSGSLSPAGEFYRHSGAAPPLGVLAAMLAGAATAGLLGVAYSYLIVYIPLIFINFIITACFGGAIGLAVGFAATWGKVRNNFVTGLLGFAFSVVGLYVAWAADFKARSGDGPFLFDPDALLLYMGEFYKTGAWTLFGNQPVTGVWLAIVWIIEALMIVGIGTVAAAVISSMDVFCERCQKWIEKEDLGRRLSAEGADELVRRLLMGEIRALEEHPPLPIGARTYLVLHLASCPTCDESSFLSLELVTKKKDKDGGDETETDELIKFLRIAPAEIEHVKNAARAAEENVQPEEEESEEGPDETGIQS